MNTLYICETSLDEVPVGSIVKFCSDSAIENKERIIAYLRNAPISAYTSAQVFDIVSGEMLPISDNARSDGTYTWYESEIYHFEKYNLKLNDDFIQHVLNRPE